MQPRIYSFFFKCILLFFLFKALPVTREVESENISQTKSMLNWMMIIPVEEKKKEKPYKIVTFKAGVATIEEIQRNLKISRSVYVSDIENNENNENNENIHKGKKEYLDIFLYFIPSKSPIQHLYFIGLHVVPVTIFSDVAQFPHLKSLTIKVQENYALTFADTPNILKNCKNLDKLQIDAPNAIFKENKIEIENLNLSVFFFRNNTFAGTILFIGCDKIQKIEIDANLVYYTDLFVLNSTSSNINLSWTISSNSLRYLPSAIIYKRNIHLRFYLKSGNINTLEQNSFFLKNRIFVGSNAMINKMMSKWIADGRLGLYCCKKTPLLSIDEYLTHCSQMHRLMPAYFRIREKQMEEKKVEEKQIENIENEDIQALPFVFPMQWKMLVLQQEDIIEIVKFLNNFIIDNIVINIGKMHLEIKKDTIDIDIETGATPFYSQKMLSDWKFILQCINTLEIHGNNVNTMIKIPACFYKLFTLRNLQINNVNCPNLLNTIIDMPSLRTIVLKRCIFNGGDSKILQTYKNSIQDQDKEKNIVIDGCINEETGRLFSKYIIYGIIGVYILFILLYIIWIAIKNTDTAAAIIQG